MPKTPPSAKRRTSPARKPAPAPEPGPLLDQQRQLDLLGLALIAFGVLIAIPLLRPGTGGVVGEAVADGARMLFGGAAYGAPTLAIAAGLIALSPTGAATTARIAAGGFTALSAITLVARAMAGPDGAARWDGAHLRSAGGALGELVWGACTTAFGSFGPYVIAILLFLIAARVLTRVEVAAVASGALRGLQRAIATPAQRRAERRAASALALDDRSPAVAAAAAGPAEPGTGTGTGTGPGSGSRREDRSAAPVQPPLPADAPRTWAKGADEAPAPVSPPEFPQAPVVHRARPARLIDGAAHFPDMFGADAPIRLGPFADDDDAGGAGELAHGARRPSEPYPDPLQEFEDELSQARRGDGLEDAAPAPVFGDEDPDDFGESELTPLPVTELDEDDLPALAVVDDPPVPEHAEHAGVDDSAAGAGTPPAGPQALTPMGRYRAEVTDAPEFPWKVPSRRLLVRSKREPAGASRADQQQTAKALIEALGHFGVQAQLVGCVSGPHITRYELRLAPGVKMSKVGNLKDDLAYALAATDIRILAPIPGKTAVGVEVPNRNRSMVRLGDVFNDAPPKSSPLTVWLGKDVEGESIFVDLAKMPHLLVAGTTGAGKSACINGMLSSILLGATPHDVRMVLVDPKQVELTPYESIPHLLTPVITSPKMAATALQNLVREMEARYSTMSLSRTRSLVELNRVRRERGETEFPYILCVIDELADLMMVAPGEVEDSIIRIAQKARAVGIHLVLATQTPRVDVITGMIKANVPSRIAFAVSSQTDSRVILDQNGAESLLGQGDMLFSPVGSARLHRIQGSYIDDEEIQGITDYWRRQGEPEFKDDLLEEIEQAPAGDDAGGGGLDPDEDPMLEEAIRLVVEMGTASTSMIQRRLRVGYTRAGRLIDMLERRHVISGYEGSKARQVLITAGDVDRILAQVRHSGASQTLFADADSEPGPGLPELVEASQGPSAAVDHPPVDR